MKKFLTLFFLVAISFSVIACEDGKDGVMGITGPSGVDELASTTCNEGDVLTSITDGSSGVVTLTCVTPAP